MIKKAKASAPGRLDVMGGISDYSGALVLQMPLNQTTEVEIEILERDELNISTRLPDGKTLVFFQKWSDLKSKIQDPTTFRKQVLEHPEGKWAIYPAGCLGAFHYEKPESAHGYSIHIQSEVPFGKGVSSSAAIEVATMKALAQVHGRNFEGTALALLAQKAENQYVGAPCGVMDQLASYHGIKGKLLPILCQPDTLFSPISIPEDLFFFGLDSGVKHEVTGASYGEVRTAAAMGYSIISQALGFKPEDLKPMYKSKNISKLPGNGFLANFHPSEFMQKWETLLPEVMEGLAFLEKFGETADLLALVDPGKNYPVRQATFHPIAENQRTRQFAFGMKSYPHASEAEKIKWLDFLGEWMFQSHASYSRCGLGHPATDWIVEQVKNQKDQNLIGAKITGGGSGGTVCILARGEKGQNAVIKLHEIAEDHFQKSLKLIDPNLKNTFS